MGFDSLQDLDLSGVKWEAFREIQKKPKKKKYKK